MAWNLADTISAVAGVRGDAPALLHADRTLSWREFEGRTNAIARFLMDRGAAHDDKLAIYSYNRPEWIESLLGAYKARVVPVNVNYRYKEDELSYLLDNSDSVAIVFEGSFAPTLDKIRGSLGKLKTFIQIDDGSPQVPWAVPYEEVAGGDDAPIDLERSGDDLLFIYTGGTTGMPKGVMWRQEDVWFSLGGGGDFLTGRDKPDGLSAHLDKLRASQGGLRLLPACPLMHGTGMLMATQALMTGGSVVTLTSHGLDAAELWREVERKQVNIIAIVGDVFARPMIAELEKNQYDLSSLEAVMSSGIMFSPQCKERLLELHPQMRLIDSYGSSEATGMGTSVTTAEGSTKLAKFKAGSRVKVLTDDGREVEPGSGERGRVARAGYIPIGYYKDPEKTAQTFKTIDGVRFAVPGDYAMVEADGTLKLLGRGSVCINTGGEKVFPEEVEEILKRHPAIEDAAVVGLPDDKWGQAVTAVVTLRAGRELSEDEAKEHTRTSLADYKTPKRVFVVESLGRSPSGKMDYAAVTDQARKLAGTA